MGVLDARINVSDDDTGTGIIVPDADDVDIDARDADGVDD